MESTSTITRRDFIAQAALLSTAAWLPTTKAEGATTQKYKMGLQLFSVRDAMAKDVAGTLKAAASMGYQDLEIYGYDGDTMKYYGYKASDFKRLLNDLGLTTTSGHYSFANFLNKPEADMIRYLEQSIEGATILGQPYITWPWLSPEFHTIEKFKSLTNLLNRMGERVTKAGLGFAYHNHDFEFIDQNGENGYDIIMRETDPSLVKLQIDLYWTIHSSKLTPSQLFNKQPGRFVMWHIKDMDKKTRDYTELGNGSIDYSVILPQATKAGLTYYYIEQGGNYATNSMQSITDSAVFFKQNLEKLL
jgi:sugar phosphate isomerase/epimerase